MKKFLGTFIFLVILAGLGLFFGWAQQGLPPDAYGFIRSKTHGLDTRLVVPGEFRWVWYKLIPTNATTVVFRLNPVSYEFSARDTLPSGKIYAAFAGMESDFSWELRAAFSFTLRPQALVTLISERNIGSQEELERYESDLAADIETFILRRMDAIEGLLKDGESPELERAVQEQFPLIEHFSLRVKSAQFPNFELYRQAKGLYEQYIALQRDMMTGELREKAKNRIESYHRFEELEQYGALLTKYPVLIDYLALER
ncbi:MAG: hypothetical protein FWF55_05695 [Treponema sp.]|nr:hypothetical protein [Treponema sp.]